MAASASMADEMEEGLRPNDLWEDAFTEFENSAKSKNFPKDSLYQNCRPDS